MAFSLAVYSDETFQEFIFPQINNANHNIVLDEELYCFGEEITIRFEVVENVWKFTGVSNKNYLTPNGISIGKEIANGDYIRLQKRGRQIVMIVMTTTVELDNFKKYNLDLMPGKQLKITVGKSNQNDICYNFQGLISANHAELVINEKACLVVDHSRNGIIYRSERINNEQQIKFGEAVNIFGLQIIWLGDVLAVGCSNGDVVVNNHRLKLYKPEVTAPITDNEDTEKDVQLKEYFKRSPRNIPKLNQEPIEIEQPPTPQKPNRRPLLLTIGPSLTMALPMALGMGIMIYFSNQSGRTTSYFMYTGIIIAAASAIIGTTWALVNLKHSKKMEREAEANRVTRYKEYVKNKQTEIEEKYEQNKRYMLEMYPSPDKYLTFNNKSDLLWNRNMNHADFLYVRLGVGDVPFQSPILIPKEKFTLIDDGLAEEPKLIHKRYNTLHEVPVGVDLLQKSLIGIIGETNKHNIVRTIVLQLAANNCYTDIKMVFFYDSNVRRTAGQWGFARWLPHVWSEDKRNRFIAADKNEIGEVGYVLSNVFRNRIEDSANSYKSKVYKPRYIVFVEHCNLLEGEPLAKYLLQTDSDLGITTILMAERAEELPNNCVDIIESSNNFDGYYNMEEGDDSKIRVDLDAVSAKQLERFARSISGIEVSELETGGEIPGSLTFLEMQHVQTLKDLNVLDNWLKNRTYENMKALIGQKAGGADWHLDIHEKYHGPHGLIAGTTGSGKSETLQTYILSLAIKFSPYDINFFIIDYKGGGMADLFSDLPHMAGQISNLSGNQVNRAMVSIKSENRRRQRLFGEYGVNHIDQYTRLVKNNEATLPIPHLFIVIDEFAELKKEEPEFMKELISVAQVGRSLGVHLILATQKPSGTVDDNIWSNSKFRLCLRVQDKQDSNDMLHKPDAAFITQAGRGYMQVGNDEIYELFQSGWSGAEYEEDLISVKTEIARMKKNNGQPAIVGNHYKMKRKEEKRIKWLLNLSELITKAGKECNVSIKECLINNSEMELLIDRLYKLIRSSGIDYKESKANTTRIVDFIAAWNKCRSEGISPEKQITATVTLLNKSNKQLPEVKSMTQLAAIVRYLNKVAKNSGFTSQFRLWLPVLPTQLLLTELHGYKDALFDGSKWPQHITWNLAAIIGLCDDPVNQDQFPLEISLSDNGHLAICGAVASGKSTFLQTFLFALMNKYSPDYINMYLLDFSNKLLSCFENSCHVGGVLYEDNYDKIAKFFTMIQQIIDKRKKLLRGGSFAQYVRVNGPVEPAILIVIDNYAGFREKTESRFDDIMLSLSRDGISYGIYLIITGSGFNSAAIPTKIADNMRNLACLEMADKFKYSDVLKTMSFNVLPEAGIAGRGLISVNGRILEYQTALAVEAADDFSRGELIAAACGKMNTVWTGRRARPVPEIPEKPVWSEFQQLEDVQQLNAEQQYLPIGYNMVDASIFALDLSRIFCWIIAGKAKSGKTNLLKNMIVTTSAKQAECHLVEIKETQLQSFAAKNNLDYVNTGEQVYGLFKKILDEVVVRTKTRRELLDQGLDDLMIYKKMSSYVPIFIFIDNLKSFIDMVEKPPQGIGEMKGALSNITEKGYLHNIFFIACLDAQNYILLQSSKIFMNMLSYKTGIYLGGNIANQKVFDFSGVPFAEQSKALKAGEGHVPPYGDNTTVGKVVIPNARG